MCQGLQHNFFFFIIAIAYLNTQESLKNAWSGHMSKNVSQSRQKLANKSS